MLLFIYHHRHLHNFFVHALIATQYVNLCVYSVIKTLHTTMLSSIPVGCVQGGIRLMGGANSTTGRVEICNMNIWGTVCSNSWGTSDANVACRQLGFSGVGMFYCSSRISEIPGQTI